MKKLMLIALAAIFTLTGSMAMAQAPQRQGRGGERQTNEQRIEQLKKQLDLNDKQCGEILKFENSVDMPKRPDRDAMKKIMSERKVAMKKILTKKQFEKWGKMQRRQMQRQPQQGRRK